MDRVQKWIQRILWILIVILGLYILYRGLLLAGRNEWVTQKLEEAAADTYLTGFGFGQEQTSMKDGWTERLISGILPVFTYASGELDRFPDVESAREAELLTEENRKPLTESQTESETEEITQKETEAETAQQRSKTLPPDMEQLKDFTYLVSNFYVADPSTTADPSELDARRFLAKDLTVEEDTDGPDILIYHTHSQEAFADSVEGDPNTSIVGVGEYLARILRDTYGFKVIHHTGVYDMIDGQLDRNKAYNLAAPEIQKILDENPGIQVVIDLHRDGVEKRFVTDINGKPTARIMFFNGLSRTAMNGPVDYLPNPYIEDNLAFTFQLSLKAREKYPDFIRCIYLQSLRYNLHLKPRSLLIESGTHLNTFQEQLNAMEPLADILNQVLRGE